MLPHLRRWRARARDPHATSHVQRVYAWRRAGAIERPYLAKVAGCGKQGAAVRCGCGVSHRPYTCRRHLMCVPCLMSRARRLRARIRQALEHHTRARYRGSRTRRSLRMLTLTWRHSGDPGADRLALGEAWRRFYKAMHRRWGWYAYVGVWEVTTGRDGLGHPHAHVIVQWPWRDYDAVRAMWLQAATVDGVCHSVSIDIKTATDSYDATEYVGKYISKGFTTEGWTPELRAMVAAGTYNTRWVFASSYFWQPFEPRCPCCEQTFVRVPPAPGEQWRAVPAPVWRPPDTPARRWAEVFGYADAVSRGDVKEPALPPMR